MIFTKQDTSSLPEVPKSLVQISSQVALESFFKEVDVIENSDQNKLLSEFKEVFDSSTGSDSDGDKKGTNNCVGKESIIMDEEYEIFSTYSAPIKKAAIQTCPFCYQYIKNDQEQLVFSSCLSAYFPVHRLCSNRYQAKDLGYKLHKFQQSTLTKCSQTANTSQLEPNYISREGSKVFIDMKVFHPISCNPLINLNHSVQLQQKRHQDDGVILFDCALFEMQNRLYQPKRIYIPFLESRIQMEVFIFDKQLPPGKMNFMFNFYLEVPQKLGKITQRAMFGEHQIQVKGVVEEKKSSELQKDTSFAIDNNMLGEMKLYVLNLKSIKITLGNLLKNLPSMSHLNSSQKLTNTNDSFLYQTPIHASQTQPVTPLIGNCFSPMQEQCSAALGRLPSFNLNEETEHSSPLITTQTQLPATIEESSVWPDDVSSMDQIIGNVAAYVKTQQGSRLIQKFFTTCTQSELDNIIKEIEEQIPDLMIDPYANYLFGSLSQSCTPQQRIYILKIISPRLIEIACDKKGTHAVQALVSLISCRQEEDLIENAIKDSIIQLIFDNQGTHLIKKIITRFSEEKLNFIIERVMDSFLQIVNHQYGLCVLKDLMTKFRNNNQKTFLVVSKMLLHLDEIIQDPYGNYAIQHALDIYGDQRCGQIIERALQKIVQLSIHKYSSNVVEKCILETSYQTKKRFILTLAKDDVNLELMKNKFGSFVLQKAINAAKVDKNLSELYATNIRQKWQDYLETFSLRKASLPQNVHY